MKTAYIKLFTHIYILIYIKLVTD